MQALRGEALEMKSNLVRSVMRYDPDFPRMLFIATDTNVTAPCYGSRRFRTAAARLAGKRVVITGIVEYQDGELFSVIGKTIKASE